MKGDRVVVVTGAAGGVGARLVGRFLANGDAVIGTNAGQEALDRLQGEVGVLGGRLPGGVRHHKAGGPLVRDRVRVPYSRSEGRRLGARA